MNEKERLNEDQESEKTDETEDTEGSIYAYGGKTPDEGGTEGSEPGQEGEGFHPRNFHPRN